MVTHPRVFDPPAPLEDALTFARAYRDQPNAVPVTPGSEWVTADRDFTRFPGLRCQLVQL